MDPRVQQAERTEAARSFGPESPSLLVLSAEAAVDRGLDALLKPLELPLVHASLDALLGGSVRFSTPVGCVLVDARKREDAGLALVSRVRHERRGLADIPILLVVERAQETSPPLLEVLAQGLVDCLFEPVHPPLARAKVAMLVELVLREERARAAALRAEAVVHEAAGDSERMLRQVEAERVGLQTIIQQLPVPVHIAEAPSGRTLHVNTEAERVLGQPIVHTRCVADFAKFRLIHPDGTRYLAEEYPIARVLQTGKAERGLELRYSRLDGRVIDLLLDAGPVHDARGVLRAVVVTFIDITERKRAMREQALLASVGEVFSQSLDYEKTLEALARIAVPELGDACILDMLLPGGGFRRIARDVNPEREALLRELGQRNPLRMDMPGGPGEVVRTGRPLSFPRVTAAALRRAAPDTTSLRLLRRIGTTSWLSVPLIARGSTFGALSILRCGPREPVDARTLRLAEELARRAALAADNARLYQQAQDAVRARDGFLQVASHELKTPLTPLQLKLSALQLELTRLAGSERERLLSHVTVAQRQVRKLSSLVGALLDVSRLAEGARLPLHLEEGVDLAGVVRDVGEWFAPEAVRKGSALHMEGAAQVLGYWDRLRLEQVVTNLLSNALRYGGGQPVHLRVGADEAWACLEVRDEGIGIAPEALGRIFGKFERAVSERHYGGLGLGLYITRSLVEAMGGHIDVTSRPGAGATFRVRLPLHSQGGVKPRAGLGAGR